ncbi:DUF1128 domain-containing protein [Alkalibacillus haloalkaliphilus]|uniref:Uncharacterized protein n=1 Tax=Alkalibacillus haloalkaliphilus TaxID=94136 RepID=A0A511W1E0_9BACI|nr:DUF1128 domain-containing protein [Alkalibacillus haloalkaliphilus]MDV2580569.1 DUF1128 domain-containing protein [Alkalibacillus haloalkaliphilus]GEN44886.1 hypothetical protein AHA02nite_06620 [Alkalibacillus haloalkaliphilus]
MNLNEPTYENLEYIIEELAKQLQVLNASILKPEDYDLDHYHDIKDIYDMLSAQGQVSVAEINAIITELKKYRKQ